jgi:hypothetical protein
MGCCSAKGCNEFFTDRVARRDARRYRRRGLDDRASRLVDFVRTRGVRDRTILEVGGGVGAIQLALLRAGAARADCVELSAAYEPYAAELLREAGLEGRVERRVLDFAERADEIAPADVVVLHKVVCCYPDYEALIGAAAAHARQQLVLTFPRAAWWVRVGFAAGNLVERLLGRTFRAYVHPPAAIIAVARSRGLEVAGGHRGLVWEFVGLAGTALPASGAASAHAA